MENTWGRCSMGNSMLAVGLEVSGHVKKPWQAHLPYCLIVHKITRAYQARFIGL